MKHNLILTLTLIALGLAKSQAQDIYFPEIGSDDWESISYEELGWCSKDVDDLITLNENSNSKALIILRNGKIALEQYFDDHDATKNWYWASAGKTLTASLVGIAQNDGLLSIDDLTQDYLGEWTSCTEANGNVTLRHQLTMTTGLDYTQSFDCTDIECLQCLNEVDQEWFYHNAPYTLLLDVIANATNQDETIYTKQAIADRIGMNGFWLPVGNNKFYFSTARSMARFGLMMLAGGDWENEEIIKDKNYYQEMITTSQSINLSYGYLWWLNGKESFRLPGSTITFDGSLLPNAPNDAYMALGKNGQYIIVIPSEDTVIIRMGDSPDESLVPLNFLVEMMDQYYKLECTTSLKELKPNLSEVILQNSVCTDQLNVKRIDIELKYSVTDLKGKFIQQGSLEHDFIDVSRLNNGFYFVTFYDKSNSITHKFYKE